MRHKYKTIAAASMLLYLFAGAGLRAQQAPSGGSNAQSAPRTLSYQGVLTASGGGIKAAGSRLLTVTLYGDANGNNKLWQSTMNTQVDSNGVFNLFLGTPDNPLPSPSAMDRPIWLGVAIDGGVELRPLSQVTASAYALNVVDNAITTAKLADGAVTTAKIADSSITACKVNMDYISSININGVQFTGHGTPLNIQGENGITAAYIGDSNTLVLSGPSSSQNAPIENGTVNWGEIGNYQISVPAQFVGTTDTSSALELHLKNDRGGDLVRVAHFQYDNNGSPNITMGYGSGSLSGNIIGNAYNGTAFGSTIAGGGDTNNVNSINSSLSFIGSGASNTIASGADYSSIEGGATNNIKLNSIGSAIAGGGANTIDTDVYYSFVGSGETNRIRRMAYNSVIGGGLHNIIDTFSNYSFIGGGDTNYIANSTQWGKNGHYANNATIAGGSHNTVLDFGAFIGGGDDNLAGEEESGVVSGLEDTSLAPQSTIAGGYRNRIGVNNVEYVWQSFIGGGYANEIDAEESVIGGGASDTIVDGAPYSTIGGGRQNMIQGPWCVIAGGDSNDIFNVAADHNVIGGGLRNIEQNPSYGVIGGGAYNLLDTAAWGSGILGGVYDTIYAQLGVIGGGRYNTIDNIGDYGSAIGGGEYNHITSSLAFLGGGQHDTILSHFSAIGGGQSNKIDVNSDHSLLGGGDSNIVQSNYSTLGGGLKNKIDVSSDHSVLVGGDSNNVRAPFSVLGGGTENLIDASASNGNAKYGSILGGDTNRIQALEASFGVTSTLLPQYASIGGGLLNDAEGHFATVSGGRGNKAVGKYATIPGGYMLDARDFQTVIGIANFQYPSTSTTGNSAILNNTGAPTGSADVMPGGDDRAFIIGNGTVDATGTVATRSNAFEVSNNGHSIVFNERGSCGAIDYTPAGGTGPGGLNSNGGPAGANNPPGTDSPPIMGGTYRDNVVYAWGDVAPDPNGVGGKNDPTDINQVNVLSEFGVHSVKRAGLGQYVIELNIQKPDGTANQPFQPGATVPAGSLNSPAGVLLPVGYGQYLAASVQVTLIDDGWNWLTNGCPSNGGTSCNFAVPNVSRIYLDGSGYMAFTVVMETTDCWTTDRSFTFQVVGRP